MLTARCASDTQVVHNYSSNGFLKLPIPEATYAWLHKWYKDNEHAEIVESSAGAVGALPSPSIAHHCLAVDYTTALACGSLRAH